MRRDIIDSASSNFDLFDFQENMAGRPIDQRTGRPSNRDVWMHLVHFRQGVGRGLAGVLEQGGWGLGRMSKGLGGWSLEGTGRRDVRTFSGEVRPTDGQIDGLANPLIHMRRQWQGTERTISIRTWCIGRAHVAAQNKCQNKILKQRNLISWSWLSDYRFKSTLTKSKA